MKPGPIKPNPIQARVGSQKENQNANPMSTLGMGRPNCQHFFILQLEKFGSKA